MKLSLEVAKEMYNSKIESIKSFALENYPELSKKELPKSWEELKTIKGYYTTSNSDVIFIDECQTYSGELNTFKTEEQAAASIALADWDGNSQPKYCIVPLLGDFEISLHYDYNKFLSFKDIETAKEFLKNFKEDIINALPLMS